MKIPDIDSIRELAEFWDTHDVTAVEDQLEAILEPVFARPKGGVIIPLSGDERTAIRKIATARGVTKPPSFTSGSRRSCISEAPSNNGS